MLLAHHRCPVRSDSMAVPTPPLIHGFTQDQLGFLISHIAHLLPSPWPVATAWRFSVTFLLLVGTASLGVLPSIQAGGALGTLWAIALIALGLPLVVWTFDAVAKTLGEDDIRRDSRWKHATRIALMLAQPQLYRHQDPIRSHIMVLERLPTTTGDTIQHRRVFGRSVTVPGEAPASLPLRLEIPMTLAIAIADYLTELARKGSQPDAQIAHRLVEHLDRDQVPDADAPGDVPGAVTTEPVRPIGISEIADHLASRDRAPATSEPVRPTGMNGALANSPEMS
jgi:hypothetical protein